MPCYGGGVTIDLMTHEQNTHERLTAIESLLTHLQFDVEQLNGAILDGRRDLDALRRELESLRGQLELLESPAESRDPTQEKPPHY